MNLELLEAYCCTNYAVETPAGRHALRIGETNAAFDAWCAAEGIESWAFVTAANPYSQPFSPEENAARDSALRALLETDGRRFWTGAGIPDRGDWEPEPSVLIANVSRGDAAAYGARFDQHAVVWGTRGAPAKLVLLSAVDDHVLAGAERHPERVVRWVAERLRVWRGGT